MTTKLVNAIIKMNEFMRSRDFTTDKLVILAHDVGSAFNELQSHQKIPNDYKIPEVNPHCPECNGSGVKLYNYYCGEAQDKDDERYLNPDIREEPCQLCERSILA